MIFLWRPVLMETKDAGDSQFPWLAQVSPKPLLIRHPLVYSFLWTGATGDMSDEWWT